ncbi:hypothetical protein [Pseudactinotalea sp. Z1748]|uniref:hypothetical protein n=1 Tax=Pseudactinotalea sp. Z1748 TaxID=3413027 RepID=UPI003C7D71D1
MGLSVLSLAVALVAGGAASVGAAPIDEYTEVSLGTPIEGVTSPMVSFTTAPDDRPEAVYVANGEPAMASVVDVRTGQRRFSQPLDGVTASWGSKVAPNGDVYIGTQRTSGELYRYRPGTDEVVSLGTAIPGETHLFGVDVDDNGHVFGGTYPGGRVFEYDPEADQFADHGQAVEGVGYVRDVAASEAHIYAGTSPQAHLVQFDRETGISLDVELDQLGGQDEIYNVSYENGLVFARVNPAGVTLVVDPYDGFEVVHEITGSAAFQVSPPDEDGVVYFAGQGGIIAYDTIARDYQVIEDVAFDNRGTEWLELGVDGFPGHSLVSSHFRGDMYLYNPETGENTHVRADAAGVPIELRALGSGPLGDVYAGGYLSPPGMARVDVDTGETELLPGMSQIEGMGIHGDELILGLYPNARMYRVDPSEPWNSPGNPSSPVPIGNRQDRPVAIASIDETTVAVGTVAVSGQLEGALTIWDTETDDLEVHEGLAGAQSPVTLAHQDGYLYGGTSIFGGLGIDPVTDSGELFMWDVAAGEVVHREVPVPGQHVVSKLAFDADGTLWGLTADHLFTFDPESREITRVEELFNGNQGSAYWVGRGLTFVEDRLYVVTGGALHEVNTEDWSVNQLASGGISHLATDRYGSLYYTRGAELFRMDLLGEESAELGVTVQGRSPSGMGGPPVTFTVEVTSDLDVEDVTVIHDLEEPAGVELLDVRAPSGTSFDEQALTWTIPVLQANETLTLQIRFATQPNTDGDVTLESTVEASVADAAHDSATVTVRSVQGTQN